MFQDANAMCLAAAHTFLDAYQSAISAGHDCRVALSGGSTPRILHRLLASDAFRSQISWNRIQFFWGDERAVAPEHPESNYHMAVETLFEKVPVPDENIHRMPAERADLDAAAREYEATLATHFGAEAPPRFDLILLGMGSDGHTASLFPGTQAIPEKRRWVVANEIPQLETRRMTFTYPLINEAKRVVFIVAGAEKAASLREVLEGEAEVAKWPSQGVAPREGSLTFLIDRGAASLLSQGVDDESSA